MLLMIVEKVRVIKKAEASMEAMFLLGVGTAKARMALAKGMKESMKELAPGKSAAEAMHLLLVTQYLDTLSAVRPNELMVRATPYEVIAMQEGL